MAADSRYPTIKLDFRLGGRLLRHRHFGLLRSRNLVRHVRDTTPFFILLTTGGFILSALKYIEITWRNPEGGGVVTITTKAFGPMWGCLGGMLITEDYFLTTAISAVSGFHYIGSAFAALDSHVVLLSCTGVLVLAALNVIGIRESAAVALVMACASFVVNLLVIGTAMLNMNPSEWHTVLGQPWNRTRDFRFTIFWSASPRPGSLFPD